ncbi:MAG: SPOR domain-containing protein [Bacteroidales bacterium]
MRLCRIGFPLFLIFLLHFSPRFEVSAQQLPEYDEIAIYLEVPRLGGTEMVVVIKGETVYLPVTDLFDFLNIRNIPAPDMTSISGFFINPEATYLINRTDHLILYQGRTTGIEPGALIRTETNLYLRADYFGRVFGLDCAFSFRSLSVKVTSQLELPMIREMRLEEMRRNLTRLKGEFEADTVIGRRYPLFQMGVADWSVIATEEINGNSEARLNLSLGAMIAGGEATAALYYNSMQPFTHKQQYYQWRYVNNDFAPVRQIMAGKIATQATSSIYNPVVGVQFTNNPSTYRRSFGSYTLSDLTEPGWIVELYVNNVLVDYVKADASGFYKFEVPLVYGNSVVQTKFYGPWGEERTREQTISIPFNFLPKNTFEYKISAGVVEDTLLSRFSRASFNYGIARRLTAGAGIEYLSSVTTGPAMPYINASWSLFNNFLLSGEYVYGVRTRGTLSYRLPSNLLLDVNYTMYDEGQKAINLNYLEELKAVLSMPLRLGKFSTYQRLSLHQIVLPGSAYTTGEWLFSGSLRGVSTNLTTYGIFVENTDPNFYSNLSLAIRLPKGFVIMPQAQYGYTQNRLFSAKVGMYKYVLKHGFLNLSFEQNFMSNMRMAELGFRYDFSFAQAGASVRQVDNRTSFVQYARGSLIYDRKSEFLGTDNRTNVGRGGIAVIPYLDLNSNGMRDSGEPKASGLNLRVNAGRVQKNEKDTTILILGLEPYTQCFIDLDPNSFDDISWRLSVNTISVAVDPNIIKTIEIAVNVVGEVTGTVVLERDGERRGIGRIIVSIFNLNNKQIGRTLTEEDGYYSYFGMVPGSYNVRIDTTQISRLGMIAEPDSIPFSIAYGPDGDIVRNLNFTIRPKPADTVDIEPVVAIPDKPVIRKDTTYMIVHEVVEELVTITEDSWAIQLGAFRVRSNAENMRRSLEKQLGRKVEIVIEDDFYKVRIVEIPDRAEVDRIIEILRQNGVTELWVISLRAKQQQLVLTERQDTVRTITETVIERPGVTITRENSIQAGAFYVESNATTLKERLEKQIDKKIIIVEEDGFFKVRIQGFESREEMEKYLPVLRPFGLYDLWILPEIRVPDLIEQPDTVIVPVEDKKVAEEIKEETRKELKIVIPDEAPEPTVAIQAGVYYKRLQAVRAQRKIKRRLDLPVEIVQQWDMYRVLVTGFYTREEAFIYYPELAGLGFQQISLIEKR